MMMCNVNFYPGDMFPVIPKRAHEVCVKPTHFTLPRVFLLRAKTPVAV
jgi:hypothetical protein